MRAESDRCRRLIKEAGGAKLPSPLFRLVVLFLFLVVVLFQVGITVHP